MRNASKNYYVVFKFGSYLETKSKKKKREYLYGKYSIIISPSFTKALQLAHQKYGKRYERIMTETEFERENLAYDKELHDII